MSIAFQVLITVIGSAATFGGIWLTIRSQAAKVKAEAEAATASAHAATTESALRLIAPLEAAVDRERAARITLETELTEQRRRRHELEERVSMLESTLERFVFLVAHLDEQITELGATPANGPLRDGLGLDR